MRQKAKLSKIALFNELLKDPDRKSFIKIITEFISLAIFHRCFPRHYFTRYLFKKGKTNIKNYFPNHFLYHNLKPYLNSKDVIDVVENKLYFDFFYGQFNISLPKILMYNHKKMFVVKSNCFEINSIQGFIAQLENIFIQNPSYDSIIIKRTYGSYGGDEVYKLFSEQLSSEHGIVEKLFSEVVEKGFLFQETVQQHPDLNRLNPSSLNTIRFDTFIDHEGKVEIISGYIRMSTTHLHVDNASSGGCKVGINLLTGKLKKDGYMPFNTHGVKVLLAHPVTNTTFENFIIPFFKQAKDLVIKAASLMPGLRLVGWDVAIGESGPVLIEGNSDYNLAGSDLTDGGYQANPAFKKILTELNYI